MAVSFSFFFFCIRKTVVFVLGKTFVYFSLFPFWVKTLGLCKIFFFGGGGGRQTRNCCLDIFIFLTLEIPSTYIIAASLEFSFI
jgi:hypothetical protein